MRTAFALALLGGCVNPAREFPETETPAFDRAVVSWNGEGEFEVELAVRTDRWQPWAPMGGPGRGSRFESGDVRVDIDTLRVKRPATAYRVRVKLAEGAGVPLVRVATWRSDERRARPSGRSAAWGRVLDVPARSQRDEDPAIAGRICSPTSLAMVLEFHGVRRTTREVADAVYDRVAEIYGNWPLNTAAAHRLSGGRLEAFVARGSGLADLEAEIAAGRPVVLSHRWEKGELAGAPVESSDGHLIVVAGFTEDGDVVANDPAADPVRRTYRRAEIERTWLGRASGIYYVVRPK